MVSDDMPYFMSSRLVLFLSTFSYFSCDFSLFFPVFHCLSAGISNVHLALLILLRLHVLVLGPGSVLDPRVLICAGAMMARVLSLVCIFSDWMG